VPTDLKIEKNVEKSEAYRFDAGELDADIYMPQEQWDSAIAELDESPDPSN
jgi:hypothetical protein